MKPRADFTWTRKPDGSIHIDDLNMGGMSVTNDAEAVLASIDGALRQEFGQCLNLIPEITYRDSDGRVDRLIWKHGEFKGFAPGEESMTEMLRQICADHGQHEWGDNNGRAYCLYCGMDGDA